MQVLSVSHYPRGRYQKCWPPVATVIYLIVLHSIAKIKMGDRFRDCSERTLVHTLSVNGKTGKLQKHFRPVGVVGLYGMEWRRRPVCRLCDRPTSVILEHIFFRVSWPAMSPKLLWQR